MGKITIRKKIISLFIITFKLDKTFGKIINKLDNGKDIKNLKKIDSFFKIKKDKQNPGIKIKKEYHKYNGWIIKNINKLKNSKILPEFLIKSFIFILFD